MKKSICSILVASVLCFSFVGCNSNQGKNNEYANRPKEVKLIISSDGYGEKWINDVAEYYMENVDTETYINVMHTVLHTEEGQKVQTGQSEADLTAFSHALFRSSGYLNELTSLYDEKVYGEDKTLGEKVFPQLKDVYEEDGKWYQIPTGNNCGFSFAYNKTTLDTIFGKDNYQLPRTTDEMFAFGDTLKEKDTYLTVFALYDNTDYLRYGANAWLAQMLGYETRQNLIDGKFFDENGEFVLQQNAEFLGDPLIKNAVTSTWEVLQKLCTQKNGYGHPNSNSMMFMDAQAALCGLGYPNNPRKVAMMFNGPWLENEMAYLIAEMEQHQELRYMKMPVMSDIITRTESIDTEEQLRQVISYIDGDVSERPMFVTDKDVKIITEARNMTGSCLIYSLTIPSTARNVRGAKDFILFLASDVAQEIALKATNGLSVLPFGYYKSDEVEQTPFAKDVYEFSKDCIYIDSANLNKPFYAVNLFNLMYSGVEADPVANMFANYFAQKGLTEPVHFYNKMYNFYNASGKWQAMLEMYEAGTKK